MQSTGKLALAGVPLIRIELADGGPAGGIDVANLLGALAGDHRDGAPLGIEGERHRHDVWAAVLAEGGQGAEMAFGQEGEVRG